jgi:hypothetical protein
VLTSCVGTLLDEIERMFGTDVTIDLSAERSFVRVAACRRCGVPLKLNRPLHRLTELDLICRPLDQALVM